MQQPPRTFYFQVSEGEKVIVEKYTLQYFTEVSHEDRTSRANEIKNDILKLCAATDQDELRFYNQDKTARIHVADIIMAVPPEDNQLNPFKVELIRASSTI